MNKSSAPPKKMDLLEDWMNHPAVDWLAAHKNLLLWGFLAFVASIFFIYRWTSLSSQNNEKEYYRAETLFKEFQKTDLTADPAAVISFFDPLNAILQSHPELKPKYEGSLAQTFLIMNQLPQAELFSKDIFKRTQSDSLQLYENYSQNSLTIAQGNLDQALKEATLLKTALAQNQEASHSLLYLLNLIRLGLLNEQLGLKQEELKVWDELQNKAGSDSYHILTQGLAIGKASFDDYIDERKKILNRLIE